MLVNNYVKREGETIAFSREKASEFAKQLAGDYNPIHDVDAKRFCVPGDLLFSVLIDTYGISQNMSLEFNGMVTEQSRVHFVKAESGAIALQDDTDKNYMNAQCDGDVNSCQNAIDGLITSYVAFSGDSFPGLLVPLMKQHNVMINPSRPMVMYTNMELKFDHMNFASVTLKPLDPELEVSGKRATAKLRFALYDGDQQVGYGQKQMVLSGLREFDAAQMDDLIAMDAQRKQDLAS